MAMTISGSNGVTYPDGTVQASGSQACKAWVNFNGSGTAAIRAAYNVTSITDNGNGDYTVNFTVAMVDANYATLCNFSFISTTDGSYNVPIAPWQTNQTTTSVRVGGVNYNSGVTNDSLVVGVAVFR